MVISDATILLVLLGASLVLFTTQVVRLEITCLGIIVVLALSGVVGLDEALTGFSSPATLTIAAMFVLSAGLERSGAVDWIAMRLVHTSSGGIRRLLATLLVPTAAFSAFMNNTPVVALMIPVTLSLGNRFKHSAAKLLMPISFVAMIAGTCTLIGTSTNIVVDTIYRAHGGSGFGMFEFAGVGVVLLFVGVGYVLLLGPDMLPDRTSLGQMLEGTQPDNFVTEVRIPEDSRVVGQTLSSALAGADEVTVLELVRDEEALFTPSPETTLQAGDVLLLESSARTIHRLLGRSDVEAGTAIADDERVQIGRVDLRVAEAIVTPNTTFRGRRVRDLGLSRRFGVQVLALRRLGRRHQYQLRSLRVQSGDVLLIQGALESMHNLQETGDVLIIDGVERQLRNPRRAPLAIAVLIAVVALAAFGVAPIVVLALAGACAMLLLGCLDMSDATRALDARVLLLLAATIPLGVAMERTGLAGSAAGWVFGLVEGQGAYVTVGAIYLLTTVLTSVLSNTATAVLLAPIAIELATRSGLDVRQLLVAITFGASASFATPIGYQTNTMVMGPGGYLFRDYLRFGLPLNILLWLLATVMIPWFWPAG
ncbi:MAG: SLC13 family permease [Planctomycetota bacterium]